MLQVGRPREPLRERHDLRPIVAEVVEMARRGPALDAGVIMEHSLPAEPVYAYADGDQIRQVLWNLVKNALQASPSGSHVRVRARCVLPDAAVFEVIDQGRGIDANQREKVYDMFHSERTNGAGIGLALVRQIIDAHHGSVDIISEATSRRDVRGHPALACRRATRQFARTPIPIPIERAGCLTHAFTRACDPAHAAPCRAADRC